MAHDETKSQYEQPGLELAPQAFPDLEVAYGQGLEFEPNIHANEPSHHGQYYGATPHNTLHPSANQGPPTSGLSPESQYAMIVGEPPTQDKPSQRELIWGIPKKRFWLILGALITLVLVIALALGLGLGLGLTSRQTSR